MTFELVVEVKSSELAQLRALSIDIHTTARHLGWQSREVNVVKFLRDKLGIDNETVAYVKPEGWIKDPRYFSVCCEGDKVEYMRQLLDMVNFGGLPVLNMVEIAPYIVKASGQDLAHTVALASSLTKE